MPVPGLAPFARLRDTATQLGIVVVRVGGTAGSDPCPPMAKGRRWRVMRPENHTGIQS
jgi:hypothetical protein